MPAQASASWPLQAVTRAGPAARAVAERPRREIGSILLSFGHCKRPVTGEGAAAPDLGWDRMQPWTGLRGSAAAGGPPLVPHKGASQQRPAQPVQAPRAAAGSAEPHKGGLGALLKGVARQVQGALPIVGLLSRLSSPSGGIGNDVLAYPEYCRKLEDNATPELVAALTAWAKLCGENGQARYVLLFLWAAQQGGGFVPISTAIPLARRLRVTHDPQIEMERFEFARDQAFKEAGRGWDELGPLQARVDFAVDAVAELSLGVRPGEAVPERAMGPLRDLITHTVVSEGGGEAAAVGQAVVSAIMTRSERPEA